MWRTFSCWAYLIVESQEDLTPLVLFNGWTRPLGKALLYSSSVSETEGQDLKDKRQKGGLGIHYDPLHPNSNTFKCSVFPFQPSTFSHAVFISQTRPLTSWLSPLFLSTTPSSDSSITSVWLPVGSSHSEMYERGEKWMANSIKSIIPEAAPCYQRHCKGVLMHCLHAQPRPLPTPTEIKVVVVQGGGRRASQSHQRPERACFSEATHSREPFTFTTRKLLSEVECQVSTSCANKEWIISVCVKITSVNSIKLMLHL